MWRAVVSLLVLSTLPDLSAAIRSIAGHSPAFDDFMRFAAIYLVFGTIPIAVLIWLRRDGLRPCVAAALGAVLAVAVTAAIGALWYRPRPFVAQHFTPLISHAPDASFPSDHLAALGAVTVCVWFASRRLGVVTAILAAIVAFARVYVGVHYVSDVAGGFILGILCGGLLWWATSWVPWALEHTDHILISWHLRPAAAATARRRVLGVRDVDNRAR